jgi:hypothetical protein
MEFLCYRRVPTSLQDQIIEEIKKQRAAAKK